MPRQQRRDDTPRPRSTRSQEAKGAKSKRATSAKKAKRNGRPDERLREEIRESLVRRSELDARNVTFEVKDGDVTLSGTVPKRNMKVLIEDTVSECVGVEDIDNQIRVARQSRKPKARDDDPHPDGFMPGTPFLPGTP